MLERTTLADSQKVELAAASVALQGQFGAVSDLAEQFGVSRNTVYDVQRDTQEILQHHVSADDDDSLIWVPVDRGQLARAITGLRVVGPNSLRDIEDLIPILYPGFSLSYGSIQAIAAEAETRAKERNAETDLQPITAGALDEMFSQGDPVLGGVDLDAGFLFLLALREQRGAADWAEELRLCQDQGLNLQIVVKDAALGIEAGVREVFDDAQQRDDCFHALYEMGKVHRQFEQRAYGAISQVDELKAKLLKLKFKGRANSRRKLAQKLRWAEKRCDAAIDRFDQFEAAQQQATEAMEVVDLERGALRDATSMQSEIQAAAVKIQAIEHEKCQKLGRYLLNRAPGLALYAQQVNDELAQVASRFGQPATILACLMLRLIAGLDDRRRAARRHQDQRQLLGTYALLQQTAGQHSEDVLSAVEHVFARRHRASSAIEGFNAALRPYLYVHKGVTQGFLELFRFYYNHRKRRWGRHKGTSAYQAMTGHAVDDWLTRLGFPPSTLTDQPLN